MQGLAESPGGPAGLAGLPEGPAEVGVVVVQRSCDGTNCVLPPGLVSGSGSTSTIAAADHESLGVLLGGGLPFRLHGLEGGVWRSVSCSFFCSLAMVSAWRSFLSNSTD